MQMTKFCTVMSTCPDKPTARKIAEKLVNEKLAACVNVVPGIESVYRWQDEVQIDNEYLLIIKTTEVLIDKAYNEVVSLHPYDVPEWVVQEIITGSKPYLDWIRSNTE